MAIQPISAYPLPGPGDLPDSQAPWRIDKDRSVVLLHDMQEYFLRPFPKNEQPFLGLVSHTREIRDAAVAAGVPVVYTAQPGGMSRDQRGLLADFWGDGMTSLPEERGIIDDVAPRPGDRVFTKWRYSAFHRTDMLDYLREIGRDQLIVGGVYAHVGCLMTAVDAFSHDIEPFFVADAVADFDATHHAMAVSYAAARCAAVLDSATVVNALGEGSHGRDVASGAA